MTLGAPAPPTVLCRVGVHDVPDRLRSLCTFGKPDYIDSFTLNTSAARERSAEGWARAILEEAALARRSARRLWQFIGLQLGPPPYSDAHVQGWVIADTGPNWIRLETRSWYLAAQAVCLVDDAEVSLSLSTRYAHRLVGRLVWAFVVSPHQRAVPIMLRQALALVVDPLSRSGPTLDP
jgi:hypothetical protein